MRIAFAQYQRQSGYSGRFSDQFIDWVIRNNYHTDANGGGCYPAPFTVGGGQCNPKNHFDNPNDGPMYADSDGSSLKDAYQDGPNDHWIQDSIDQIGANRNYYQDATFAPDDGVDISRILSAFGQNTHALADFYAHTNWIDDPSRGGCVKNSALGGLVKEEGYVPVGLGQTTLWDESSSPKLYSGTVAGTNVFCANPVFGDITCSADKTTHGYWNKDGEDTEGGKQQFKPAVDKTGWRVEAYSGTPPKDANGNPLLFGTDWYGGDGVKQTDLKVGDRIYVSYTITKMHQLAFELAVEHTLQEIAKLYDGAAGVTINGIALQDIFKMDKAAMDVNHIVYDGKLSKQ
ncbi:MAG: hypothetical protein ACTS5I_01650 [Rhodanobacter sp.]